MSERAHRRMIRAFEKRGGAAFRILRAAEKPLIRYTRRSECDHPGIEHGTWSYTGICPGCQRCKFIGHGPLCLECYDAARLAAQRPTPAPTEES